MMRFGSKILEEWQRSPVETPLEATALKKGEQKFQTERHTFQLETFLFSSIIDPIL
jgi:hypothetical protein